MERSELTATLLSAILRNQEAISEALRHLAEWAENSGQEPIGSAVKERLLVIDKSRSAIGTCIGTLMGPKIQL